MSWLNGRVLDLVILVPIAWRALGGYRSGLVAVIGGLVGRLAALLVAWHEAPNLAGWKAVRPAALGLRRWLAHLAANLHIAGTDAAAATVAYWVVRLAAFLALFIVINLLLRWLLGGLSRGINRVPLIGGVNRLTGAVAGALAAALVMGLLLSVAADAGTSWHIKPVAKVESHSPAARVLEPVGHTIVSWVIRGVPSGRILALETGLPGGKVKTHHGAKKPAAHTAAG